MEFRRVLFRSSPRGAVHFRCGNGKDAVHCAWRHDAPLRESSQPPQPCPPCAGAAAAWVLGCRAISGRGPLWYGPRSGKGGGHDDFDAILRRRRLDLAGGKSEEHTSELQSLMRISYAVFGLKK